MLGLTAIVRHYNTTKADTLLFKCLKQALQRLTTIVMSDKQGDFWKKNCISIHNLGGRLIVVFGKARLKANIDYG